MKLNKRGVTLMEVIVSVTLISIVMIFLFKILITLRYDQEYSGYDDANSVNRTEIIREIQNDFGNLTVKEVIDESTSEDVFLLNFVFADGTAKQLMVEKDAIYYNDKKWSLKKNNDGTIFETNCVSYNKQINKDYFMFKIVIKVNDKGVPNVDSELDDIEIFYMGIHTEGIKLPEKEAYLGYNSDTKCTEQSGE